MSFFNFKAFGRNSKKNKNGASNLGPSSNAGTPNTSTNASVLGSSHNQIMNSSNTQAQSIYSNQPSSSSKLSLRKISLQLEHNHHLDSLTIIIIKFCKKEHNYRIPEQLLMIPKASHREDQTPLKGRAHNKSCF